MHVEGVGELRGCPFCGEDKGEPVQNIRQPLLSSGWSITCDFCDSMTAVLPSLRDAAALWNGAYYDTDSDGEGPSA